MTTAPVAPLAERMRPHTLDSYVGQQHILAKDQPLFRAIQQGELHSCILWGPWYRQNHFSRYYGAICQRSINQAFSD